MNPDHYQLALQEQEKKIAAVFKFKIKAGHKILENGISTQDKDSFESSLFSPLQITTSNAHRCEHWYHNRTNDSKPTLRVATCFF